MKWMAQNPVVMMTVELKASSHTYFGTRHINSLLPPSLDARMAFLRLLRNNCPFCRPNVVFIFVSKHNKIGRHITVSVTSYLRLQ